MSTSLTLIDRRKRMANMNTSSVNRPNIDNIKSPISLNTMETFLSNINNNVDINFFGTKIFDKYSIFADDNQDKPNQLKKIQNFINQNIIPSYHNLHQLDNYMRGRMEMRPFVDTVNSYMVCDRVLKNDSIINRRFNVDKFIESNMDLETEDIVGRLCEFIDTYDISDGAKLNLALENIPYMLKRSNFPNFDQSEIVDYVSDYFLMRENVLTDTYMRKMRKVIKSCPFVNKEDVNPYIFENVNYFGNKLSESLSMTEDELLSLNTEKKVSNFLFSEFNKLAENVNDNPKYVSDRLDAILALPLAINVSESFMESHILNNSILLGEDSKEMEAILTKALHQYDNGLRSLHFLENIQPEIKTDMSFSEILESELEDKDIRDLFKKFKAEQNKDLNWFKRLINKLYAKKPEEIIDGFPHLLGIVRSVFILAPIGFPMIGPVLTLVASFVDRLISLHINTKQVEKLSRYVKSEKGKMEEKLDSLDGEKKKKTESYIKNLDNCLTKINQYSSSELDNDIIDDTDDFDFDFDLESYVNRDSKAFSIKESYANKEDHSIEESALYMEALENILTNKNYIQNFIARNIANITENCLYSFSNIISNCPITVDYDWYSNEIKDCVYDPMGDPCALYMDDVSQTLQTAQEEKIEAGLLRNVIIESECINTIKGVINEGFKISDIKLAFKSLKSKMKDLSTKEKSVCQSIDANASVFLNNVEKMLRSDRREAIIKGSLIPSFSRTLKLALGFTAISIFNPIAGLISIMGYLGASKKLNKRERQLIYDEIETELKVTEKELQMAENDGDMKRYRFLLQYQKKLTREKQRIRYGMRVSGQRIPPSAFPKNDD